MRKTLLLTFFALIAFAAGAWAQLTQDANGYYLLGSVQDWKDFAEIVNSETNTAANAKMIADIDLGDDQTYISPTWRGDYSNRHYHGTFDGQGHTLTVHYNSSNLFHTPFSQTSGATIKNLHVAGTITSNWTNGASHISGLISNSAGSDVIQNVWVSVDISGGVGERLDWGAFVGCNNCGNTTITDCLFTGSITNTGTRNGCLAGLVYQGSVTTSNCLSTGTFNFDSSSSTVSVGTMTNCYIKTHPASIPSSMQVTDAQLSNGTTTAALQNGRSEEIWVQDPVTNQPILKTFVSLTQDANGYYKIGSVQDWKNFAEMVNSGTNPAANAKMTADINLGDDQTMIGDKNALTNYDDRYHYQGIFDGQGHTLTVAYVVTNTSYLCATFAKIKMATIKNLHVDGTMTSCGYHTAGVVSDSRSTARIENVWCSVAIVGTSGGHDHYSGIAGCLKTGGLTISDCLFTGSITTATSYTGHFIGYIDSGTATTTNSLSTATFSLTGSGSSVIRGSASNVYYVQDLGGTRTGCTQVTAEQISNGTTTAALQNGRSEEIWVQDPVTYQPVLKLFANDFSYNVPASGVGSFSSKAKVQLPDGLTAYYCKEYNSTNGTIAAVPLDNGVIPANTGVLIRGEAGAYTLSATNATAATVEDNALVAVTEATHVDATNGQFTNFMLSSGKFIKIAASSDPNVKMPANKAYLQLALGNTSSKEFTLLWDEDPTKAISPTISPYSEGVSAVFDLQGRKVANPVKGRLYIINGKVVKY